MNTLYQTGSPSHPYGDRNGIVAERAIDHRISSVNLLSTVEKKLKRAYEPP